MAGKVQSTPPLLHPPRFASRKRAERACRHYGLRPDLISVPIGLRPFCTATAAELGSESHPPLI